MAFFTFANPIVLLFWCLVFILYYIKSKRYIGSTESTKPGYIIAISIAAVFLLNVAAAVYYVKKDPESPRGKIERYTLKDFKEFSDDSSRVVYIDQYLAKKPNDLPVQLLKVKSITNFSAGGKSKWALTNIHEHQSKLEVCTQEDDKNLATTSAIVLAYYHMLEGEYAKAMNKIDLAKGKESTGFYLFKASIARELKLNAPEIEELYWREIEIKGNVRLAVDSLRFRYRRRNETNKIDSLYAYPTVLEKYKRKDVREYWWNRGKVSLYFQSIYRGILGDVTFFELFISALIVLLFVGYLYSIDAYNKEHLGHLIFCLVTGILVVPLTIALRDLIEFGYPGFYISNQDDPLYWIINVGLTEELIKSIPLLMAVYVLRVTDEPIDYLIYAGLGALGFAFLENAMYFGNADSPIFMQRAAFSTVGHLSDSFVVGYALAYKYHRPIKINAFFMYIIGITLASVLHGFYDFFILGSAKIPIYLLFFIITLFLGFSLISGFVNNALNNSKHYDARKLLNSGLIISYLISGFAIIYILQFAATWFSNGWYVAINDFLFSSSTYLIFLVVSISFYLGTMDIFPGRWRPITFYLSSITRRSARHKSLQKTIVVETDRLESIEIPSNEIRGLITDRVMIGKSEKYLLVSCKPYWYQGIEYRQFLVKTSPRIQIIKPGTQFITIFGVPIAGNIKLKESNEPENFKFHGPVRLSCIPEFF